MYISNLKLRNWRNFTSADVDLKETVYLIGPNASGKSNLLDIFRFMRDIVNPKGGGLQQAIDLRGGLKKIRSLAARKPAWVELEFEFREDLHNTGEPPDWCYKLWINYEGKGKQRPIVIKEEVWKKGTRLVARPDPDDNADPERKIQTHLEQINMNREYREVSNFFSDVLYLHLVPQLLKFSDQLSLRHLESDPFGQGLLEEISGTQKRSRDYRLRTIENILKKVIPNLEQLQFKIDDTTGRPHLEMLYNHWRPNAGWQREDQFSDGTLRLLAMLWTLLSSNRMILLEEPELSLHNAIVEQIPDLLYKTRQRKKTGGQILVSTHSEVMLSSQSIDGNFLILQPGQSGEATRITPPSEADIEAMKAGLSPADILLPQTAVTVQRI
ncbi:AAA family ATPase [Desulfotignum phosphitoxidans]|uniref:Putative ATPase n=1 Tax=Desulfotignum phosphitoxidans DSM 13687 TaxID=1286635 RepID=S0FZX6_9BACT|nr:ATP-binding protein [Desulfotignum phosphitoxidans]EMS78734.1 putative ATPase [Desulfotignum phosphitoxidans DSM 13687]